MNQIFVTEDERIKLPNYGRRLLPQGNPFFVGASVPATPSPSSTTGSNAPSKVEKTLAERLHRLDQRSLLTGALSSEMDAAHIINASRGNEDLKADVVSLAKIEASLHFL